MLCKLRKLSTVGSTVALVLGVVCSGAANAQLTGPVYPAPGGTNFSSNGVAFQNSGYSFRVGTYSGFDSSQYSQLYWGESSNTSIGVSMNAGNTISGSEWLSLASITGNSVHLVGQTSLFNQSNNTPYTINTHLYLYLWDSANNAINFVTGSSVGLSGVDFVADVTSASATGGFHYSANLLACGGISNLCSSVSSIFNSNNASGGGSIIAQTSVSTGFFYAPVAAVPEPETYAMLIAGLGFLGFMARRRRQQLAA